MEHITNLGKLKKWLHVDKSVKLFIFDEGLAHIPRRTSMSHKNVELLKMLAELSKGHARMIICSQIAVLDKDIMNPAFTRAVMFKQSKKVLICRSKHFAGDRMFTGLPRSPIRFDPDRLAPFIDTNMSKSVENWKMGLTYEVAELYVKGSSMPQIKEEKQLHQEEARRHIKKALK